MGDPVIRDFRLGIDPLIFSKPISRGAYLLGKFCGNFFMLICCQSAFALTLLLLQFFRTSRMVVLPFQVTPYFKHFFFVVVISHLVLAAFYFTAGTLTRSAKVVYGLAASFYLLYIAYQELLLQRLPLPWRTLLDPLGFNAGQEIDPWNRSADLLNHYVVSYSSVMIANRALMILVTAACLITLYLRFTIAERLVKTEKLSVLNLSTASENVYASASLAPRLQTPPIEETENLSSVLIPQVTRANEGFVANLKKLIAAIGIEFRLLRAERSLIVLLPLAIALSVLDVALFPVAGEVSYSAAYASHTASALWLFLIGLTVFYTGEAMHRDREARIEPVLWAMPAPNHVFLLSKFLATTLLALCFVALVGVSAVIIQIIRGHAPLEIQPYLIVDSLILFPGIVVLAAASLALNVLLRDKYLAYAVSIGIAAGLFYLFSVGYNHWLYNPTLYHLWKYADLTDASRRSTMLMQRLYWLVIAVACLAIAHFRFQRKATKS